MYFKSITVLLALLSVPYLAQSRTVCNGNFCTETHVLQIHGDEVSLGIALPPLHSPDGKRELLLNATVPSAYGFVAFTLGNPSHALHICNLVIDRKGAPSNASLVSELRSQCGTPSDGFIITNPALANTTISPRSRLINGRLQIVSRLESFLFGHHDLLDDPFTVIRVTLSKTPPIYLDGSMDAALLDLANSSSTTFVFDRAAASFANFSKMATQLGI